MQNRPDGISSPSMLMRAHRAFRAIDRVFRAMEQLMRATRDVKPATKPFNFVTQQGAEQVKQRSEMTEALGAEPNPQTSRVILAANRPELRALNHAVGSPRLDTIVSQVARRGALGVRAETMPLVPATTRRAFLPKTFDVRMNGALLADSGIVAARSASRVSARGSDAATASAEKLSVGINLGSIESRIRPENSTRRTDALSAIAKTHRAITRTLGSNSNAESRARVPEFVEPVRDSARQTTSSAARGVVTINSSPTVVIHASEIGASLEQQVADALRKHREDMFNQLTRELARRDRAEY